MSEKRFTETPEEFETLVRSLKLNPEKIIDVCFGSYDQEDHHYIGAEFRVRSGDLVDALIRTRRERTSFEIMPLAGSKSEGTLGIGFRQFGSNEDRWDEFVFSGRDCYYGARSVSISCPRVLSSVLDILRGMSGPPSEDERMGHNR